MLMHDTVPVGRLTICGVRYKSALVKCQVKSCRDCIQFHTISNHLPKQTQGTHAGVVAPALSGSTYMNADLGAELLKQIHVPKVWETKGSARG
jgi:hypothetical protein